MLQRTSRTIISHLWKAGEKYGWRSIRRNTGFRYTSPQVKAVYTSINEPRRPWSTSHSWHHPFTITKMSTSHILASTVSPETCLPLWAFPDTTLKECHVRLYSTKPSPPQTPLDENHNETKGDGTLSEKRKAETVSNHEKKEEKMGIVQKFKLMYKQYCGVDIVPLLEQLGAGEKILSHLQNSNAGYYAIAYAMYKVATPARYTITVGGTTISINYLKKRGYIKPVPSAEQLKDMYEGKREEFIEKKDEMVEKYQEKREEIKDRYQEKREEMLDRYQEKREEMVERYQEKREEMLDRYQEKREELKDKVIDKKEEFREKLEEGKDKLDQVKDSLRKKR